MMEHQYKMPGMPGMPGMPEIDLNDAVIQPKKKKEETPKKSAPTVMRRIWW